MPSLIFVKLGGSVITDKNQPYTARPAVIKRLASEIKAAKNKGYLLLISHGSGSFGHTSAAKYGTAAGAKGEEGVYGLAVVQQDALAINQIVNEIFLKEGLPVLSFVPSSFSLATEKKLTAIFAEPIIGALKLKALPLVFGDIVLDEKLGCCIYSGERTLDNLISPLLRAGFTIKKVIQCGSTNGVYNQKGQVISKITPQSFERLKKVIGGSGATDVTGGMLHKIEESLKMAKQGIDSLIINGEKEGNLLKAILGKKIVGTLIALK
jgi:isopentenyl phosphate kinase